MEAEINQKLGTVTVQDLINVCHDTYTLFRDPEAKPIGIPGFELIKHQHDPKSDHSGLAYYQEKSGTVVFGHRGSATAKDWLMTDVAIAFNSSQTRADLAALKFAESVLADLDRENKPVNTIIGTGHSKGGRECQMVIKHLTQQGQGLVDCVGMTLNSARVYKSENDMRTEYQHVNLQISGGSRFSTDVVSSWGSHLGPNVKMINPEVGNFVTAHKMQAFDTGIKLYENMTGLDVRNLVKGCKAGMALDQITNENHGQIPAVSANIEIKELLESTFPKSSPSIAQFRLYESTPPALHEAADYVVDKINAQSFVLDRKLLSELEQHLPATSAISLTDAQLSEIQNLPPVQGAITIFSLNEMQARTDPETSLFLANSILVAHNYSPINGVESAEPLQQLSAATRESRSVQPAADFFVREYAEQYGMQVSNNNDNTLSL